MNTVTVFSTPSQPVTMMTTREVAGLVQKQHGNIKISAERLSEKGIIGTLAVQEFTHNGNTYTEYLLNKRDSLVLVAQNCPEFTAKLVDRWQELEAAVAQPAPTFKLPTTFSEALRLAAEQAEKIEAQALQLQHQKPAVEFVDRYTVATGLKGVREVCKILNANERQFVDWMTESGIMYRLAGRLTPYQPHIDAGRFLVKTGLSGDGHAFSSPKFTAKGVSWVAGEWGKFQVSGRG